MATCNSSTKHIRAKSCGTPLANCTGQQTSLTLSVLLFDILNMCVISYVCPFNRYVAAAMALDQETNGGVRKFEVCDNIDLEMVLMEYESYHYVKFQKYPKLMKKTAEPGI